MSNLSGRVIKSYQIIEQLDEGGFGAVYRAFQPVIERDVAIKVILPRFANDPDFIRRFETEAQTIARMEHPHIVPLYDFWRDPEGAYLVMRWLRGGSLRDLLDEHRQIPVEQTVRIIEQICGALSIAHRQGIVHRDIKPENILFDEDGNAYLTDFGIAQKSGHDNTADELTGSAKFVAPETIQGQAATPQTDIYSLGLVLYEMLTGIYPYPSERISELLFRHLQEPLPHLGLIVAGLPDMLDHVVQTATAKAVDDRYASVVAMMQDLYATSGSTTKLEVRPIVTGEIENPYKGLRPFQEADSSDFFGREGLVNKLISRLNEDVYGANFLALVGPSGSGKSSVIRAGLIPKLRGGIITNSDNWFVVDMIPGYTPLKNLETALLRVAVNAPENLYQMLRDDPTALGQVVTTSITPERGQFLLILIDQFEELFTQVDDETVRQQFLDLIYNAVTDPYSQVYIVVTIRADFFDKPLLYEGIGDLIQSRTQVILPLSTSEIESAITGPAQRVGLDVATDLIAAMVADVREEPGALPLLQFALTELFERRTDNRLTLAAYQESGGVQGALARRAQDVYAKLPPDHQQVVHQIFLRLITLGEGAEDTRRRVKRSELYMLNDDRDLIINILDLFGHYRLLTFDQDPNDREPTVEIAHEALIYRWEQMQKWLSEGRHDIRLQRMLATASREWREHQEAPSFLLMGGRLLQFEEWAAETNIHLAHVEQDYLQASIAERERQAAIVAEQQRREAELETRSQRLLRMLVYVFALAGIIGVSLAIFAVRESEAANIERNIAQEARDTAQFARDEALNARATSDANASAAQTQLEIAQRRAAEIQNLNMLNTAEQALEQGDSGLAMNLLLQVSQSDALTPAVERLIYEVAYRSLLHNRFVAHDRKITALAISADGQYLATGSEDLSIILWDMSSLSMVATLTGHRGPINSLAFSPDGTHLVSAATDGLLILWDVATASEIAQWAGHQSAVTDVAYSPDGQRVASSANDRSVIIWDANTGDVLQQLLGHQGSVRTVAFHPDGTQVLSGGRDNQLILWDIASGDFVRNYEGHSGSVDAVTFNSDGSKILSASADRILILWDTASGRVERQFTGHVDVITSVSISSDDTTAISSSCAERDLSRNCLRGSVIMWDMATGLEIRTLEGHLDTVNVVLFLPDNRQIATASCGEWRNDSCVAGEFLIWDEQLTTDTILELAGHDTQVTSVAYHDGVIASGGSAVQGEAAIRIWDADNGTLQNRIPAHIADINSLMFRDDGRLLSASADGNIYLWDVETGEEIRHYEGHQGIIYQALYSPDETLVLSAGSDTTILWSSANGELLRRYDNANSQIETLSVAFNPSATMIATGLNNGTILLLDLVTGEEIQRFIGHTDDINTLILTDEYLISGSKDRSVRLWDVATGRELQHYEGHTDSVTAISLVEDHYIMSASADNTLRLWDRETGLVVREFTGHSGSILDIALAPNDNALISASADGTLREWRVSLNALITWIQAHRYVRDLTDEERQQYDLLVGEGT